MIDLCCGIQVDLKLPFHELTDGLLEFGGAIVHVTAVFWPIDFKGHLLPNFGIGHRVVFADSKIEQSAIGIVSQRLAFGPFDLFEFVDFVAFSVTNSADSLGKKLLEIGVLGGNSWLRNSRGGRHWQSMN